MRGQTGTNYAPRGLQEKACSTQHSIFDLSCCYLERVCTFLSSHLVCDFGRKALRTMFGAESGFY